MSEPPTLSSPLLRDCPPSLPARAYRDPDWHARELDLIWRRDWVHVGRLSDLPPGTLRRVEVGGEAVLVARAPDGAVAAFLNVCPHRGSELCGTEGRAFNGKLITCPYHAWAFDIEGRLRSTAFATPTADFDAAAHGLTPVAHRLWKGGLFLSLADPAPDFVTDPAPDTLANWPMDDLVTGHVKTIELNCNWKIFWENYNECLHCPGIHPGLSQRVPVYRQGIMSAEETGGTPFPGPVLEDGTQSWTVDGQPCGPVFAGLSAAELAAGHTFVTIYPSTFVVAHVDYVRQVTLTPLAPDRTRVRADWLFAPETVTAPEFDLDNVVRFAEQVLAEDGAACEMNQRGLASRRFEAGRLMPQEFDIKRFHDWVRARLG